MFTLNRFIKLCFIFLHFR